MLIKRFRLNIIFWLLSLLLFPPLLAMENYSYALHPEETKRNFNEPISLKVAALLKVQPNDMASLPHDLRIAAHFLQQAQGSTKHALLLALKSYLAQQINDAFSIYLKDIELLFYLYKAIKENIFMPVNLELVKLFLDNNYDLSLSVNGKTIIQDVENIIEYLREYNLYGKIQEFQQLLKLLQMYHK